MPGERDQNGCRVCAIGKDNGGLTKNGCVTETEKSDRLERDFTRKVGICDKLVGRGEAVIEQKREYRITGAFRPEPL